MQPVLFNFQVFITPQISHSCMRSHASLRLTTSDMTSIVRGVVSSDIMVSLSSYPSTNLTLVPSVYWTPFSGNKCNSSFESEMLGTSDIQIVPQSLTFTSPSSSSSDPHSLNRLLHLNASFPASGCLYLSLEVLGDSADEYEVLASRWCWL
jgi:hypothetical protein